MSKPYRIIPDTRHKTHAIVVEWQLASGETGQPFDGIEFPDKTVQMSGTFGAAVTMEGSNDVTGAGVWNTLTDPLGNVISMTSGGIETILENPYWVRPNAGAITGVTVRLSCAQSRR